MASMQPCLWFNDNAEEAVNYYVTVLPGCAIRESNRYANPDGSPGNVITVEFTVAGMPILALNAGPAFQFTPAVSLMVDCDSQAEADTLFDRLADGGATMACGWVTDRFGVTWQVVPPGLKELLFDPDPGRAARAFAAMESQVRLNVDDVRAAVEAPPD